jgi:hypothetical protein
MRTLLASPEEKSLRENGMQVVLGGRVKMQTKKQKKIAVLTWERNEAAD